MGGSLGVLVGGFISDRVVKGRGIYARVAVIIASLVSLDLEYNLATPREKICLQRFAARLDSNWHAQLQYLARLGFLDIATIGIILSRQ